MRIEDLLGLERLTINQCARIAKDTDRFDSMEFYICGPIGKKKCKWVDAYMGLIQMDGSDKCIRSKELELFPIDSLWFETIPLTEDA